MNTEERESLNRLSGKAIGAAQAVSIVLGCGFLEKVYENAMAVELKRQGLKAEQQKSLSVRYAGCVVGEYLGDIVVENRLLLELKAVSQLDSVHEAQCINYLKASGLKLCLLLNFARPRLDVRRIVHG
jgi:GxxExxY protein